MDPRNSLNVTEYIDWTTGLLLTDGSTPPAEAGQQVQPQQPTEQSSFPSLSPIFQLSGVSPRFVPSYALTQTTDRITTYHSNDGTSVGNYAHRPQLYLWQSRSESSSSALASKNHPFSESPAAIGQQRLVASAGSFPHTGAPGPGFPSGVPISTAALPVVFPDCQSNSSDASVFLLPVRADLCSRRSESASGTNMDSIGRSNSRGKVRNSSHKRGTSVMSEPTEDIGGRSFKFQRSHSSSLVDYDDLQSTLARDPSHEDDGDDQDGLDDGTQHGSASPTPSEERRSSKGGRQNHSEIEKRRRDKMNTYITELSRVVPMCITMSHKLDKLTVLRMAVQHLKTIRGAIHSYSEGDYKPAFLSDEELKRLILQSADGFVFVADSNRGRMLYVSESVTQVLNYAQGDLLGQSWFDILHPKDVAKVKEQLSSSDLSPRERLIDAKTMLPVSKSEVNSNLSRLCPGARRSFFCRMKCKNVQSMKECGEGTPGSGSSKQRKTQATTNKEKKYVVVHCTGYLKSWAPAKVGVDDQDNEGDVESCNLSLSCLVAVGRLQPSTVSNVESCKLQAAGVNQTFEFISRHSIDGKFLFVDQRATLLLGLLPQELLGTSMYEYYHSDEIASLAESHKAALQTTETVTTGVYRFRVKEGIHVKLRSRWKSFRNPWTKEIEFLVSKNAYVASERDTSSPSSSISTAQNLSAGDIFYPGSGLPGNTAALTPHRVRLYSMEIEASKIGQTVADEVLDSNRSRSSASGMSSLAVRSPGSMISGSTTASPFSNVGSPLEQEGGYSANGSMPNSFPSNEDPGPSSLGTSVSPSNNTAASESGGSMGGIMRQSSTFGASNPTGSLNSSSMSSVAASHQSTSGESGSGNGNSHAAALLRGPQQSLDSNHINKIGNSNNMLDEESESGLHADEDMMEVIMSGGLVMDQSRSSSRETNGDGNDEAAMAVVMSLLEADAGLGGPVDFSGLPWPLP